MKKLNRPKAWIKIVTPSLIRLVLFRSSTIPSTPGMSSSIRPMRRAAQLAAIKINQIAQNDAASSDSDQSIPSTPVTSQIDEGMLRAIKSGYDSTIHVIRFLIDEMNNAKFEDERCEIAEKMFDLLNKNPNVLIFEPKFRDVVVNKLKEVQDHIDSRTNKFQIERQQELIRMMAMSVRIHVRNSSMRQDIYKHLSKINKTLKDYKDWTYGVSLKNKVNNLYKTLDLIKSNPSYVTVSPTLN